MRHFILALAISNLAWFCGSDALADDKPQKEPSKITVAAEGTPFEKEVKLGEGDCFLIILPNKKEVAIWAEKIRFPAAEQQTKSGLLCLWGEKPFELKRPKDSHIEQGSVITSTRQKATEHELFVGEWQLSYINDNSSTPELKVKVVVTKREEKE